MSGIINSVGARSGVIGSTEIPGGYEEGTWTPVLSRYSGGAISTDGSITIANNNYTKIGNLVTVHCHVVVTGSITQGSSFTYVAGLPFDPSVTRNGTGPVGGNDAFTTTVIPTCFVGTGSRIYFLADINTNTTATVAWKAGNLILSIAYVV